MTVPADASALDLGACGAFAGRSPSPTEWCHSTAEGDKKLWEIGSAGRTIAQRWRGCPAIAQRLLAGLPAIDDGIAPVTTETTRCHTHPDSCLASLVLTAIHQLDDLIDSLAVEARLNDRLGTHVTFDIAHQNAIQRIVIRQRVTVLLIRCQLGTGRAGYDPLGNRR